MKLTIKGTPDDVNIILKIMMEHFGVIDIMDDPDKGESVMFINSKLYK